MLQALFHATLTAALIASTGLVFVRLTRDTIHNFATQAVLFVTICLTAYVPLLLYWGCHVGYPFQLVNTPYFFYDHMLYQWLFTVVTASAAVCFVILAREHDIYGPLLDSELTEDNLIANHSILIENSADNKTAKNDS